MQALYERLVFAIFAQAVKDYEDLKRSGIYRRLERRDGCGYSIKEIERFLTGAWAAMLLKGVGCNITGKDILKKAKKKYLPDCEVTL